MVEVVWKGGMAFESKGDSGNPFLMDAYPEAGGAGSGPTPVEALLGSIAACSAMDVVSILRKKQQTVTGYRIEVKGERSPEGEWPRPFLSIELSHVLQGDNLDPVAVARAIELSNDKYCTVMATLRKGPRITTSWLIEEPIKGRT